jgi:hypothetical protein
MGNGIDTHTRYKMLCKNCDKETSNEKFCSRSCAACFNNKKFPKRQKKVTVQSLPKTLETAKTSRTRRFRLIEEQGHRCSVCLNSVWMDQPIPLQIDHIDGNHMNNERFNLRIVCPNCHAQTPTFCGSNIGHASQPRIRKRLQK